MTRATLSLAALLTAISLGAAQRADAASYLGSPDTTAAPESFACAACPAGTTVGFRQFALRGRVRTKVVASLLPRNGQLKVLMRSARL